jgi:hypothetical protein
MEDQEITEEDTMKEEKTGILSKRTIYQPLEKKKLIFL